MICTLVCRLRLAAALAVLAALSACSSTYSADRLLTDATARPVLGERVTGLMFTKSGKVSVASEGLVSVVEAEYENGRYVVAPGDGSDFDQLSFHPIPGTPGVDLIEAHSSGKKRKTYGIGRQFGARYAYDGFVVDKATWAAVKSNGLAVTEKDDDTVVGSAEALLELSRLYTQINANRLASIAGYKSYFKLAKTPEQRESLLVQAAESSCLALAGAPLDPALGALSGKYSKGVAIEKIDADKATRICARATAVSTRESVHYAALRIAYKNGKYSQVWSGLDPLIEQRYALAAVLKADMMSAGTYGPADPAQARELLSRFAERGSVEGEYFLAYFERHGKFGKAEHQAARSRLETLLARRSYMPAQVALADMYVRGLGGKKRPADARTLYLAAAEKGNADAQQGLGQLLYFGTGGPKDAKAAYGWLQKASRQGLPEAQYIAGFMLARGQGVAKSESKARTRLTPAAKAGHTGAQAELGRLLLLGLGGKPDRKTGLAYLQSAKAAGSKNAAKYLKAADGSTTKLQGVPAQRKSDVQALLAGKTVVLSAQNQAFLGGLGSGMLQQCGAPSGAGPKLEMQKFVLTAANASTLGTNYSDKDLRKSLGSSAQQQALFSSGIKVGEQVPCAQAERAATRILKALRVSSQGSDGGLSIFVKSCRSSFDQKRCQCLADTGRTVMPDIHQQRYRPQTIKTIIGRNPFIGLQIATTCGIVNY